MDLTSCSMKIEPTGRQTARFMLDAGPIHPQSVQFRGGQVGKVEAAYTYRNSQPGFPERPLFNSNFGFAKFATGRHKRAIVAIAFVTCTELQPTAATLVEN